LATSFNETAEMVLGNSSAVLVPMQKDNPDAFDAVIEKAVFRTYVVKFKTELETDVNVSSFINHLNWIPIGCD